MTRNQNRFAVTALLCAFACVAAAVAFVAEARHVPPTAATPSVVIAPSFSESLSGDRSVPEASLVFHGHDLRASEEVTTF